MSISKSRICNKCKNPRDLSEFSKDSSRKDGVSYICKYCNREKVYKWQKENRSRANCSVYRSFKKNPEKTKKRMWRQHLKKYGLTIDQYENILSKQGNRCAVSGEEFGVGDKKAAIDHDHVLGQVRGIIQLRFNTAEGHLKTPEDCLKLYDYMIKNDLFYSASRKYR